eukprot:sb/3477673/
MTWGAGAIPGNSYVLLEHPLNPQLGGSSCSFSLYWFILFTSAPHIIFADWSSSRRVAASLWLVIPVSSRFFAAAKSFLSLGWFSSFFYVFVQFSSPHNWILLKGNI